MSTRIFEETKGSEAIVAQVETQTEVHEVDQVSVDRMLDQALVADSPQSLVRQLCLHPLPADSVIPPFPKPNPLTVL